MTNFKELFEGQGYIIVGDSETEGKPNKSKSVFDLESGEVMTYIEFKKALEKGDNLDNFIYKSTTAANKHIKGDRAFKIEKI